MTRHIDWSSEEGLSHEDVQYLVQRPWEADLAVREGHTLPDEYYELSGRRAPMPNPSEPQPLTDLDDVETGETGDPLDEDVDEEEDDEEEEEETVDYSEFTVDVLKTELEGRGLKTSGSKDVLVARLEQDDQASQLADEEDEEDDA